MEFDMTDTLSPCTIMHRLPCRRSQSSQLRVSGNVPNPFVSEPCGFWLWFPGEGNLSS